MKKELLQQSKKICGYLVAISILWINGGQIKPALAAANVSPTGPAKVRVGQTFNVGMNVSGAKDVDTFRLNGSFTNDLFEYKASRPTGVFQNVSPGTYVDQAKGIFSFGAFTLSSRANGNTQVAVLTFKATKVGKGYVQLTNNSRILSAGEEQIGSVGRLNIEVIEAEKPQPEQPRPLPAEVLEGEAAIALYSRSHPNPDVWYPSREIEVGWEVKGKAVRRTYFGFDDAPEGASEGQVIATTSTKVTAPNDGIYYAHLTVVFQDGEVVREHLRLSIDTLKPELVSISADQDEVPPQVPNFLRFGGVDRTSGVKSYDVFLNGTLVTSTIMTSLALPTLKPDYYTAQVRVLDRAGNATEAETKFSVVSPPVITPPSVPAPVTHYEWYVIALLIILILLLVLRSRQKPNQPAQTQEKVIHRTSKRRKE